MAWFSRSHKSSKSSKNVRPDNRLNAELVQSETGLSLPFLTRHATLSDSGRGTTSSKDNSRLQSSHGSALTDSHDALPFMTAPPPSPVPLINREVGSGGASSTATFVPAGEYFKSRRLRKEQIEQPWLKHTDPRTKWVTIIPLAGFILGLIAAGLMIFQGLRSVVNHRYCPVLIEDFASWNESVWSKEVEVGGFGYVSPSKKIVDDVY